MLWTNQNISVIIRYCDLNLSMSNKNLVVCKLEIDININWTAGLAAVSEV